MWFCGTSTCCGGGVTEGGVILPCEGALLEALNGFGAEDIISRSFTRGGVDFWRQIGWWRRLYISGHKDGLFNTGLKTRVEKLGFPQSEGLSVLEEFEFFPKVVDKRCNHILLGEDLVVDEEVGPL